MKPRLRNHLLLALGSMLLLLAARLSLPYPTVAERLSVATAWLCLLLLAAALLFSPLYLAGRRSPAGNHYLRRDIGIWSALHGLAHVYFGNVVAMNSSYIATFVRGITAPPAEAVRDQLFSWGSIAGLVVAVLYVLLLLLSSDWSIRWLGLRRWKGLQKIALPVLWLTLAHGVAFQVLESRYLVLSVMLLVGVAVILVRRRAYHATG